MIVALLPCNVWTLRIKLNQNNHHVKDTWFKHEKKKLELRKKKKKCGKKKKKSNNAGGEEACPDLLQLLPVSCVDVEGPI